jgi:hypothetical protein
MRGDVAWVDSVAQSGRWDDPPYWTSPEYLAKSPWGKERLAAAFAALRLIYTPKKARAIFRRRDASSLYPLLTAALYAYQNPLVFLGIDAAECEAWKYKSLTDALTTSWASFEGAAFEIALFAALKRAKVSPVHEPLATTPPDGSDRKNPDFSVTVGGRELLLELKLSRLGSAAQEQQGWLNRLAHSDDATADIPFDIETLPLFGELQERDGGSWMRGNFGRLRSLVEAAKERLVAVGPFPAVEVIEHCIQLRVRGPRGSGANGGALGPWPNVVTEAERVIRNLVSEGATQIPADRTGVLVIDPGWSGDADSVCVEVRRWLDEEGVGYSQVVGVLVVARRRVLDLGLELTSLDSVWRVDAPNEIRDSAVWNWLGAYRSTRNVLCYAARTGRPVSDVVAAIEGEQV